MKKFLKYLRIYIAQQYFLSISSTLKLSRFLDDLGFKEEKKKIPLRWKIVEHFCKTEFVAINQICNPITYRNFYEVGFSNIEDMVLNNKHLMNEAIAISILKVLFTSYPCSGDWGYNFKNEVKNNPDKVIKECLRYIHSKDVLENLAKDMLKLHGEPPLVGFADAKYQKIQLVYCAITLYRECGNKEGMLQCANYLWEHDADRYAFPKKRHWLLNLFLEIGTPEALESLSKIIQFFENEGTNGPEEYLNFAHYSQFVLAKHGPRCGFLV